MSTGNDLRLTRAEAEGLERALVRMNAVAWGLAVGLLLGGGLFLATLILVLRGGDTVGPHLGLLRVYFPGYRVTASGSLIGLAYGFCVGYGIGWFVGVMYNRLVARLR